MSGRLVGQLGAGSLRAALAGKAHLCSCRPRPPAGWAGLVHGAGQSQSGRKHTRPPEAWAQDGHSVIFAKELRVLDKYFFFYWKESLASFLEFLLLLQLLEIWLLQSFIQHILFIEHHL